MGFFGTIMKIIMIIVVAALTICVILGAILMIFPTVSIFGLHYVSSSYGEEQAEYLRTTENSQMWEDADSIRIETGGYDIVVRVKETGQNGETYQDGTYASVVNSSYKGFVWGGDAYKPTYSSSISENKYLEENGNNVFYVRMAEPGGFLIRSQTLLTLIVESGTFENKNLEINTKGGSVTIGGDVNLSEKQIRLKNLDINAGTGKVSLQNITVSDTLNISKYSGDVVAQTNLTANTELSIVGGYGIIDLKDVGQISSESKLKITTTNTHTTIGKIYGDFEFKADGGLLETGEITKDVDLDVKSCDCRLGNLNSTLNVVGGDGYLKIPKVAGNVTITMNNGETTIFETNGEVVFESQKGSLTLSKAQKSVTATTVYGNIDIVCDGVFPLDINNKHGSTKFVNAKDIVNINASNTIDNKGTGNITGTFAEINGESSIFGYAGNVEITVPQNEWLLSWRNVSGKVDIKLGSLITDKKTTSEFLNDTSQNNKWIDVMSKQQAEESESPNRLLITNNSGKIQILAGI